MNKSLNSLHSQNKELVVKSYLETLNYPVSPYKIAKDTMLNHSTVRGIVRRLIDKNQIKQPYPHYYCSSITYGVMKLPLLRVHNVVLTSAFHLDKDILDDYVRQRILCYSVKMGYFFDEYHGDVHLIVQFGSQRNKVTFKIACDDGMDRHALELSLNRCMDIAKSITGETVKNVICKTLETNRDFLNFRLDGAKCYTVSGLFGALKRMYQKEDDKVRVETKFSQKIKVDEMMSIASGGMDGFMVQHRQALLNESIMGLTEKIDVLIDLNRDVLKYQKAILDKLINNG